VYSASKGSNHAILQKRAALATKAAKRLLHERYQTLFNKGKQRKINPN